MTVWADSSLPDIHIRRRSQPSRKRLSSFLLMWCYTRINESQQHGQDFSGYLADGVLRQQRDFGGLLCLNLEKDGRLDLVVDLSLLAAHSRILAI